MLINDVLRGLADKESHNLPFFRQELVIRLAMWLRYPCDSSEKHREKRNGAVLCGLSQYALQTFGNNTLEGSPEGIQKLLLRNLSLAQIVRVNSGEQFEFPDFRDLMYYRDRNHHRHTDFDDYSYTADITKFMLWYDQTPLSFAKNGKVDARYNARLC